MPLYVYSCPRCGQSKELLLQMEHSAPYCCGGVMNREYSIDALKIVSGPPLWTYRMDEIHKAQADRGERLRFVHPKEIRAS